MPGAVLSQFGMGTVIHRRRPGTFRVPSSSHGRALARDVLYVPIPANILAPDHAGAGRVDTICGNAARGTGRSIVSSARDIA